MAIDNAEVIDATAYEGKKLILQLYDHLEFDDEIINRLDYLPDALELLKSDFPEGYELIRDYFLREDKVTMWYLVEKYGLSIDMVRYRIKIAKQKLKEYIILHENE